MDRDQRRSPVDAKPFSNSSPSRDKDPELPTPEQIVEIGYDRVAQNYHLFRRAHLGTFGITFFAHLLPAGGRVLDAGCGSGVPATKYLAERGFKVVGVDISENMLNLARVNAPQAQFIKASLSRLRLPLRLFDGIACLYSLLHVPRMRQARVLKMFYTALKPGGFLLLTVGMTDNPGEVEKNWLGTDMYFSHYDWQTSLTMIKSAGFRIDWTRRVGPEGDRHVLVFAQKPGRTRPLTRPPAG